MDYQDCCADRDAVRQGVAITLIEAYGNELAESCLSADIISQAVGRLDEWHFGNPRGRLKGKPT